MLWHLVHKLADEETGRPSLRQLRAGLWAYLNETCEHHWPGFEA
jgi:hypothetical protein